MSPQPASRASLAVVHSLKAYIPAKYLLTPFRDGKMVQPNNSGPRDVAVKNLQMVISPSIEARI